MVDGAVGERGEQHPLALPHQLPHQACERVGFAGARRALDQMEALGRQAHRDRIDLRIVHAGVLQGVGKLPVRIEIRDIPHPV
jgi:hypothetical protein